MKLISCENCGLVMDQDRFKLKHTDYEAPDGTINLEWTEWNSGDFIKCVKCPACEELVQTSERI